APRLPPPRSTLFPYTTLFRSPDTTAACTNPKIATSEWRRPRRSRGSVIWAHTSRRSKTSVWTPGSSRPWNLARTAAMANTDAGAGIGVGDCTDNEAPAGQGDLDNPLIYRSFVASGPGFTDHRQHVISHIRPTRQPSPSQHPRMRSALGQSPGPAPGCRSAPQQFQQPQNIQISGRNPFFGRPARPYFTQSDRPR